METIRNKVMNAFAAALSADRGIPFVSRGSIAGKRAMFDTSETAESTPYGKTRASVQVSIEVLLDAGSGQQGDVLDEALGEVIRDAMIDPTLGGLADSIRYTGSAYEYADAGSKTLSLVATFQVQYLFLKSDPTQN